MDIDRRWARMVNQWISYDIGWRVAVCFILFHISIDCANYATCARAGAGNDLRVDGADIISVPVGVRCGDNARASDDNADICRRGIWTQRDITAQRLRGNVDYHFNKSALCYAGRISIIIRGDIWADLVLGRNKAQNARK